MRRFLFALVALITGLAGLATIKSHSFGSPAAGQTEGRGRQVMKQRRRRWRRAGGATGRDAKGSSGPGTLRGHSKHI